jgi:hypothetical protein
MDDGQQMSLSRLSVLLGIFVALPLAVIGIVLWFPWYWPTMSVKASSETVDSSAGMPLSFSIENEGVLKAHSARYRCYFAHVQTSELEIVVNDSVTNESPVADVLLPHDPIEVTCPGLGSLVSGLPKPPRAVAADVAILVSFRPSFDWRRASACGRYILLKNAAGQLAWFRRSSTPCKELAKCTARREVRMLEYRETMRRFIRDRRVGKATKQPTPPTVISCLPKE